MPVSVLHVCDKFGVKGSSIHGVSRLFSWWFPRYDASRFTVTLCGLKDPEPASQLLEEQGIPVRHLRRGRFDPRIFGDLVRLSRQIGARILHVHGYAAADFGRLAAARVGAGLVLHEHFADPRMPAYQALADRVLAPLTDRAIAVSGSTRDFLVRQRHVPADRVQIIWNGAPLAEFASPPPGAREAVRHSLGIPRDAVVIGTIGRLNAQKGHRYLLEAVPRVVARHPDTRFLVVGDGDLGAELRRQTELLGVADHVIFAGHRTDVPALLAAIDVFCIPSLYEGTPLALFEAMAAGRAIVATAVDGCAEVLAEGKTALLVAPRNGEALAGAILRCLEEPGLGKRLSDAAREASAGYDIDQCVSHMQGLYDDVLAERSGGGP